MGSKTFDGVWFITYSNDHPPPHVHGRYAGTEVILELREDGIAYADRADCIRPVNAKRSDIVKIFNTAADYEVELKELWSKTRAAS